MLTISKPISAGQVQTYHREEFQNAQENYYTEGDTIRGQWRGRLAEEWGLSGEVSEEHFARIARGQHPVTGEQLVRHQVPRAYVNARGEVVKAMEHRAAWDATFSAPKSVSLTALVGGDGRVRQAHQESVDVALSAVERYVQARMGGNRLPITTSKWAAIKFEHDSSRPVEGYAAPQVHTHVLFFNVTELEGGETRALQPRELYRAQRYGSAVYRSELAPRLKALGYEVERGRSGEPVIKGYTREYLDAMSPRRRQIEKHLEEAGQRGAAAAQIAAHQTREGKLDISHEEMQRKHQEMAAQYDHQPQRVVAEARERLVQEVDPQARQQSVDSALTYAREKSLERAAVVDERELVRDALTRSLGEARLSDVRAELERRLARGELIEVEARVGRAFTTEAMVRHERENVEMMRAGQGRHEELAREATRREVLAGHPHLSEGQRAAALQVLSNRDQVMALEGGAGTGKTTSLSAIREAAEREGLAVEGFAPTSRAAQKLEEAGIPSSTLQRHLARGAEEQSAGRHLYIVDESSLASTRQMNDFLRRLQEHDRVLLVGDVRQHQAVEAGRPYEQLQEAGMQTARLKDIVRQRDPELKEVVERLARRQVREALEGLDEKGRVREIVSREERLQAIAQEYARRPEGTLVVSPDNRSRREINALIHGEMQRTGQVEAQEQKLRVLEPRQELTGADRAWAGQYERGDVLRYAKGSRPLGLEKGEYVRVERVDEKENKITVERMSGERVTYDPRRLQGVAVYREAELAAARGERVQFTAPSRELGVANRELGRLEEVQASGDLRIGLDSGREVAFNVERHPHLDYGYAVTSHSSQGQTADRVLLHAETGHSEQLVNSRLGYVAVSRARFEAQVFTDDKPGLVRELSREVSQRTALGEVAQKAAVPSPALTPSPPQVAATLAVRVAVSKVQEVVKAAVRGHDQEM